MDVETQKYTGHSKRVSLCAWNTACTELISTASFDCGVHVWNVMNGSKVWDFNCAENVLSLDWNATGTMLSCTTKDHLLHVFDPRNTSGSGNLSVAAHEGLKTHKAVWLDSEHLATTGFSKSNERQIRLWDTRNFTKEYF